MADRHHRQSPATARARPARTSGRSRFADSITDCPVSPEHRSPAEHYSYRRCFGMLPDHLHPSIEHLVALGAAFRFNDTNQEAETDIPVGYTYLCQFVFHDLTLMVVPAAGASPFNRHSGRLELDSVFGEGPARDGRAVALPVGRTIPRGQPCDLPRDGTGRAAICDTRSDDNLPLAQTHVAVLRFHNAIVAACPGLSRSDARALAVAHFQSVVIHDLLPRLIDPAVYEDVMANGRCVVHAAPEIDGDFAIPLEFAAACARFGHAMIRNLYRCWNVENPGARLYAFWRNTFNSSDRPLDGTGDLARTRLFDDWIADWTRLLGDPPGRFGLPPLLASRIDTVFAQPLSQIPQQALPQLAASSLQPSSNIAALSLLRGLSLRLNSGPAAAARILARLRAQGRPCFRLLTSKEMLLDEPDEARRLLTLSIGDGGGTLAEHPPLWLYILKEAAILRNGMRLGPVGSRIVMETLHAAIEAARPSILGSGWRPDPRLRPSQPERYSFPDLIAFAGLSTR